MHDSVLPFGDLLAVPLRNGVSYSSKLRGSGVSMVNMREIFAADRIGNDILERVPISSSERVSSLLEVGDLLFARQSLTYEGAGKCSIVIPAVEERTWESHLIRARLDRTRAQPEFYYYYFRSAVGRRNVETIVQQVAAAGIRGSDLVRLKVPVPPLADQGAIAQVLGALDKKIVANERSAASAVALARTLLEGVAASGHVVRLKDTVVALTRGVAPTYTDSEGLIVVNQKCVRSRRVELAPAKRSTRRPSLDRMLSRDDVLVNSTGYGTLGRAARWTRSVGAATVDSHITIVRFDESKVSPLCAGLTLIGMEGSIEQLAEGSTGQTELKRNLLGDLELRLPILEAQQALHPQLRAVDEFELACWVENERLASTRDELLPLLMSGKLRVKDAEKAVEKVL